MMGAHDLTIDAKVQETCFHGRHIQPQIYAGLASPDGWRLKDYEQRDGYKALRRILDEDKEIKGSAWEAKIRERLARLK